MNEKQLQETIKTLQAMGVVSEPTMLFNERAVKIIVGDVETFINSPHELNLFILGFTMSQTV